MHTGEYQHNHIDGLVQEKRNSIANALELRFLALNNRYDLQLQLFQRDMNS